MLPLSKTFPGYTRLLAVVLSALFSACTGGGGRGPAATLRFDPEVEIIAASGEAPASARAEADRIVGLLTEWYQQAFLEPKGWENADPIVKNFVGEAKSRIRKELASVTIGEGRADVVSVTPLDTDLNVTLFVDGAGEPSYAIASVVFDANGTVKRKGGLPLHIVQRGTYYLRREAGDWKIFAYTARADQAQNPVKP